MDLTEPFRALTPTLDGPVLRVLAGTTEPMARQQVTNLVGGVSEAGVRKVLRRLSDQGLVIEQRFGTQYTYAANRDHIMWPAVDLAVTATARLDTRIREHVEAWPVPALSVELFGSAATGSATTESDVDLMLFRPHLSEPEQEAWDDQIAELRSAVERWTGNPCEVFEIDPPGLIEMAAEDEPVLRSPMQRISGMNLAAARPSQELARLLRAAVGSSSADLLSETTRRRLAVTMPPELQRTLEEFSRSQTAPVREAIQKAMRER